MNGQPLISVKESKVRGEHNRFNMMTAMNIAALIGADKEQLKHFVRSYRALPHRIEYIGTFGGKRYYNDSKGTNTDASIRAVLAMQKPIVLIAGGYDKGVSFDDWTKLFLGRVKHVALVGVTAPQIRASAEKFGFTEMTDCETFTDAVNLCRQKAEAGDCVLLSPACASWGMFDNYEQRGDLFKAQVNAFLQK